MSNLKLPTMTYANLSKILDKSHKSVVKVAYATEIMQEAHSIAVFQHGNRIATIAADSVYIDNCGYDTTTTATRLRKILSDNGITYYVRIKQYAMRLYNDSHTELDSCFRSVEFVNLSMSGQNWVPNWETLGEDAPARDTSAENVDLFAVA